MTFFAFGFNYESAPLEVRDTFALDESLQRALYQQVKCSDGSEWIILSTCNRTEVYLFGSRDDISIIQQALSQAAGTEWQEEHSFFCEDENAVRHVLHVTSGLKSLVIGDAQILSQVKNAYRIAVEESRVGTVLHRLMHTAFRTAKRILHETSLATGAASISSAAVAMAREYIEKRGTRRVGESRAFVIGAGQMGRLALLALSKSDFSSLLVTNRSHERALHASRVTGATAITWDQRYEAIRESDVVIVATGANSPVIAADDLTSHIQDEGQVLIIDIGVPRNVDPKIDELENFTVLDLDALNEWISRVQESRKAEVPSALSISEEMLSEFVTWMFHQQALQPAIQAIRDTFEEIRLQAIEQHGSRFTDADQEDLDVLTRSIMQKLLAVPIVRLKNMGPESIDFVRGIKLLEYLFSRPECEDGQSGDDVSMPVESETPGSEVENPADLCRHVEASHT